MWQPQKYPKRLHNIINNNNNNKCFDHNLNTNMNQREELMSVLMKEASRMWHLLDGQTKANSVGMPISSAASGKGKEEGKNEREREGRDREAREKRTCLCCYCFHFHISCFCFYLCFRIVIFSLLSPPSTPSSCLLLLLPLVLLK